MRKLDIRDVFPHQLQFFKCTIGGLSLCSEDFLSNVCSSVSIIFSWAPRDSPGVLLIWHIHVPLIDCLHCSYEAIILNSNCMVSFIWYSKGILNIQKTFHLFFLIIRLFIGTWDRLGFICNVIHFPIFINHFYFFELQSKRFWESKSLIYPLFKYVHFIFWQFLICFLCPLFLFRYFEKGLLKFQCINSESKFSCCSHFSIVEFNFAWAVARSL